MTQAQDLAVVLATATSSPNGITIRDTAGDSLTLSGMSASTITASAAQFHFA